SLELSTLNTSSLGSNLNRPAVMRLLIARSSWLIRAVCSVPGATRGTLNDAEFIPGTTRAPTTHPLLAEFPGQTRYVVVGVTVHAEPRPLTETRLGVAFPP